MSEPTHDEVKQFVYSHPRPFVKTSEVENEFDSVSGRTVRNRLNDLHQNDEIEKTVVEPKAAVWWVPDQSSASG